MIPLSLFDNVMFPITGNYAPDHPYILALAESYRIAARGEGKYPPPIVFSRGPQVGIADGCHRIIAARLAGLAEIPSTESAPHVQADNSRARIASLLTQYPPIWCPLSRLHTLVCPRPASSPVCSTSHHVLGYVRDDGLVPVIDVPCFFERDGVRRVPVIAYQTHHELMRARLHFSQSEHERKRDEKNIQAARHWLREHERGRARLSTQIVADYRRAIEPLPEPLTALPWGAAVSLFSYRVS